MFYSIFRNFRCLLIGLFVSFFCVISIFSQDEVIRVDSELISVPVSVFDRDGRYLTDLKKENFRIFENDVEQEISLFETVQTPFTALLLLDNSGSMGDQITEIARAAGVFVGKLRDDDKVIIATFSDRAKIQILVPPTLKKNLKGRIVIKARTNDSSTTTFDALDTALEYMTNFNGRRAVILFTDGEMFGLGATAKTNLQDAEESETLIYPVKFGKYPVKQPGFTQKQYEENLPQLLKSVNEYLEGLATKTGGRKFQIESISDLESTFSQIADELRQQFNLGYYPKTSGKIGEKRQIKVRVNIPNAAVRSRTSFTFGENMKTSN